MNVVVRIRIDLLCAKTETRTMVGEETRNSGIDSLRS